MKNLTKIMFFTDAHGSEIIYRKALNAAIIYKVNVLIFGGDISGKYIVPVFQINDNLFEANILGESIKAPLKDIENRADRIGGYIYLTNKEEWNNLIKEQEKMDKIYLDLAISKLKNWLKLAEDNLKPKNIKFYANIGNDDHEDLEKVIESSSFVINPNKKVVKIDDFHEMISLSYTNITPWNCYGDRDEEYLFNILDELAKKLQNPSSSIFNFHCPPFGTKIDLAPKLDQNLRPIYIAGGEPEFDHVGCKSVRQIIEKYQPLISLHGHIHESNGFEKIGKTIAFNPGSEYTSSIFKGILINLSENKLESYMFING
jgi:Icc-related predicted phosphoesterase